MHARHDPHASQAGCSGGGVRRLELGVGDEHAEHDPRPVPAGDRQRVLAVDGDPGAGGGLAIDVVVGVDVARRTAPRAPSACEPRAQLGELLAQHGVLVAARVARHAPARAVGRLGRLGPRVAAGRGDHRAGAAKQRLRMARALRVGHREAHVGEEARRAPLADQRLGARRTARPGRRRMRRCRAEPPRRPAHG